MLSKRIIACLDVRGGVVVKGRQFEGLRQAGDPAALARRYNEEGIDEVVILDDNGEPVRYMVEDWVQQDTDWYIKEYQKASDRNPNSGTV